MEDVEVVVRRIVALSDVNVITKRMVRREYEKLRGGDALTTDETKMINSILDKIVLELAQKMQMDATSSSETKDNEELEREKTVMLDSSTLSAANQQNIQIIESQNEISKQKEPIVDRNDDVCEGNQELIKVRSESTNSYSFCKSKMQTSLVSAQSDCNNMVKSMTVCERNQELIKVRSESTNSYSFCKSKMQTSLVSAQPDCNNMVRSRTVCAMNKHAQLYRLTSSEVLAAILIGDTSESDFYDSPEKSINMGGNLSKQADFTGKQRNYISDRKEVKSVHRLEVNIESDSSEENMIPNKKYKLLENDEEQAVTLNNNQCTFSEEDHGHRSDSQRIYKNIFQELSCQKDNTNSPQESCSTDDSLELLKINNPKCIQDSVIEVSSDDSEDCLYTKADVCNSPISHYRKTEKDQAIENCRQLKKNFNVMESNSDNENSQESCESSKESCENSKESCCSGFQNSLLEQKVNNQHSCGINARLRHAENYRLIYRPITDIEEEQSEVLLLSETEFSDSSATELISEPLLETFKVNTHIHSRESDDENCDMAPSTSPESISHQDLTSDDSFTANCKVHYQRRKNKLKNTKRFLDTSDSELDNIGKCQKMISAKTKFSGKDAIVPITVVDENSSAVHKIISNNFTPVTFPESSTHKDLTSDDSFTSNCKVTRRNRFKRNKRYLDTSESELDNIGECPKSFVSKTKLCGKNAMVQIKVVDRNSSGICEIKNGVLTDLDVIEDLEKCVSRNRREMMAERSRPASEKLSRCMQQKTTKQKSGIIRNSDKNTAYENNQRSRRVKYTDDYFDEKTCTSTDAFGHYVLDSDIEDGVPLSYLKCSGGFASRDTDSNRNTGVGTNKCLKVKLHDIKGEINSEKRRLITANSLTRRELNSARNEVDYSSSKITSHARNEVDNLPSKVSSITRNEDHESNSLVVSTLDRNLFDFYGSDIEMSLPNPSLVVSRNTTLCSKENNSFSASRSVYDLSSSSDDEHFPTLVIHGLCQESDSEETSSSLDDISPIVSQRKVRKKINRLS